ncbi:hypothetical protein OHA18_00845 [Kribbella sp. NBC_00709]|uniref:hypothetical protein n=1 Tax=Kribbella sp. NBC_00709 TaxID=2975972 RepID=UPI002E2B53E8|nr:hypothetical protein [Kribbella sp. NBC_00709]
MTNDDVRSNGGPYQDDPDEMSQEEQARLLTEPSFDHRLDDESELLEKEFGPPERGGYGRPPVEDTTPEYSGSAGS